MRLVDHKLRPEEKTRKAPEHCRARKMVDEEQIFYFVHILKII